MATGKKKTARKSTARKSAPAPSADNGGDEDEETSGEGSTSSRDASSGRGIATDTPEGRYETHEALPDYYRGFAHEGAESYAIVPHEKEDEAISEGLTGRWENARDGHYVVSVMPDEQQDEDEDGSEDEDEDEDNDD